MQILAGEKSDKEEIADSYHKKGGVVKKGIELAAPLHLTWSCYQSDEPACTRCDSCALRLRAFAEAGVEDSIPYRTKMSYR